MAKRNAPHVESDSDEEKFDTLQLSDEESESEDIPLLPGDEDEFTDEEEANKDRELEKLLGEEGENENSENDSDIDSGTLYSSDSSDSDTTYVTGADGKPRPIRPEIDPVYDSDDSDKEEANTIGNIPLSAYDQMPHIGYDIDGKRIMRPATSSALDSLLETIDLPKGWTGLLDKNTGKGLELSSEELDIIKRIQRGENPDDSFDPFEDQVEWFSSKKETMPLTATPEPKRRFVPSKHEAKRVMKIVRAIREGRIVLNTQKEEGILPAYDIWADNAEPQPDHIMTLRAPKLPPPTNEESYNPPAEYLLNDDERKDWENTDPVDRERNFMPKKYSSLRQVPGYGDFLRERFERSLDLYLAPRIRRHKLNIDPDSLIPDLPSPKDLRPFPIKASTIYRGHIGKVRSVSIDPSGQFVATGGDDGTVRIWEVLSGRQLWKLDIFKNDSFEDNSSDEEEEEKQQLNNNKIREENVECVEWNPSIGTGILAVSAGDNIYFVVPPLFHIEIENNGKQLLEAGWVYATNGRDTVKNNLNSLEDEDDNEDDTGAKSISKKSNIAKWTKPSPKLAKNGCEVVVRCKHTVKKVSWHRKGDYLVSTAPEGANSAVLIHKVSNHTTQSPFRKSKGIVQYAMFHPFRPHLYVATQRYVRVYDLSAQVLAKIIQPGVRWLSSFDIHPQGDNIITSSYDKRLTWHDMDLSTKPYKTLRYHDRAVRDVSFHKGGLPLFCSASDDGNINVFHGSVYDDMMKNPLLVPLKVLKGHEVKQSLGILNVVWHPREPWLFSAGADGTARLWTA